MNRIMLAMPRTLGDVMCMTTIIRELKVEFPEDEIHFYTDAPYDQLLKNNPYVTEVHASDHWHWNQLFLKMALYDCVFMPYQMRPECNVWHQRDETRHQHLVDFYWKRMGMHRDIVVRECELYPSEEDRAAALDRISFDVPRIAIHVQSGVATKDWPYFEELVEEMRKAGYAALQVGGPKDKLVKGAVDFRGKMPLLELAAFLSNCAAFVGLDSGVSYMADAMKISTIVIQGSTHPTTSGPYSDRVVNLFVKDTGYADCQVVRCHSNCRHEKNCIEKISVDEVLSAINVAVDSWRRPIPAGV